MNRSALAATGVVATLALAACGSANAASNGSSSPSPSGSANANARRGGTAGELVRINGSSLVLNTQQGDVNVSVGGSTPVTKTRTGTVADITVNSCITATGTKDPAGVLTATAVGISPMVNGSCTGFFGRPGGESGQPNPSFSPRPNRSPRPGGGTPPAFVRGQVTAVNGTQVTIQQTGANATGPVTITVPTTVRVGVSQTITPGDLAVGDCVLATGQKDSSGTVQARSVNVVPPGPSGCFTGNGGGFRFGGGGGGGGFGGGGGGFGGGGGGAAPNNGAGATD